MAMALWSTAGGRKADSSIKDGKNSQDAVFHPDGSSAEGPIALCEVQGYVFAAKRRAARLALTLGHTEHSRCLLKEADKLRTQFERHFWCNDLSSYALALDGFKQPCRVRTSNAGHCLWTGLAEQKHGMRTAMTLVGDEFFNGWGVRTVATTETCSNPMAYHNGSVWPHANALIAAGMAAYGFKQGHRRFFAVCSTPACFSIGIGCLNCCAGFSAAPVKVQRCTR